MSCFRELNFECVAVCLLKPNRCLIRRCCWWIPLRGESCDLARKVLLVVFRTLFYFVILQQVSSWPWLQKTHEVSTYHRLLWKLRVDFITKHLTINSVISRIFQGHSIHFDLSTFDKIK